MQQRRVSCELRMQKEIEHKLIDRGAARRIILDKDRDPEKHGYKKTKVEILDEAKAEAIKKEVENSDGYQVLINHRKGLLSQEKYLLTSAEKMFADSKIWAFCEHVRGLGPVAALTFFTIVDAEKLADKGNGNVVTSGKVWKYCGLVPGQKLQAGKLGGYNTTMKGRTYLLRRNIVMANDPYYAEIYRIEKEYYKNRPDHIAANGWTVIDENGHYVALALEPNKADEMIFCPVCKHDVHIREIVNRKKRPGWKIWIDMKAARFAVKVILSHATEIIATEQGYAFAKHSNYIPPKPYIAEDQQLVLESFRQSRLALLSEYYKQFAQYGDSEQTNGQIIRDNMQTFWQQQHGLKFKKEEVEKEKEKQKPKLEPTKKEPEQWIVEEEKTKVKKNKKKGGILKGKRLHIRKKKRKNNKKQR